MAGLLGDIGGADEPGQGDLLDPATFQLLQRWRLNATPPDVQRYLDELQRQRDQPQVRAAQIPGLLAEFSALSPQSTATAPASQQPFMPTQGGGFESRFTGIPLSGNIEDRRNPVTAVDVARWLQTPQGMPDWWLRLRGGY